MRIGVIADTHGLIRPEALDALQGVEAIVHAGDIGGNAVLEALREIAPVTFVRGNVDDGEGHQIVTADFDGLRILLAHILPRPHALRPALRRAIHAKRPHIVVFGHSHLPHDEVIDGIRFFNPASAGPRRFDYPVAVGILEAGRARHIPLDERSCQALVKRMNQLSGR
ncbi:MAG TPA: metallophosphoesterase family protein [Thermoanaerobaculia bacterium]|nr:metallophosphoesterase family protein [Thermoanaerobaculia bacterium]